MRGLLLAVLCLALSFIWREDTETRRLFIVLTNIWLAATYARNR